MMVPIREMTDVMKVVKEVVSVKPRQWVRLKRGIYKDDLAQVCHNCHHFRDQKKVLCGSPGKVDFLAGQVFFQSF